MLEDDWEVIGKNMTFDVRHIRSIRYRSTMGADQKLAEDLRKALEALGYRGDAKFEQNQPQGKNL